MTRVRPARVTAAVIAFWFVGRGSSIARSFVIVVLVLAALPLGTLPRFFAERAVYSASYLVLGFALKAVAAWLLFTGDSGEWFFRPLRLTGSGANGK